MAIVEGALNIEAGAVQEGDAVRQKHGDASTQLRAGCSRQPALRQQSGLKSADWALSEIPIVLSCQDTRATFQISRECCQ